MSLHLSLAGGLAAAIVLASVGPVAAATAPGSMSPTAGAFSAQPQQPDGIHVGFDVHDRAHIKGQLRQLHDDAVAMQTADGGQLSASHRAVLDQRLRLLHEEACSAGIGGC